MNRRPAFTLIEILVVVAIIALLAAILMPALKEARRVSKRTMCLANLKQIGNATYSYLQNNRDTFPTDVARFPTATPEKRTIADMLRREMGGAGAAAAPRTYVNKVFLCPADQITKTSLLLAPEISRAGPRYFDSQKTSYEWNDFLDGRRFRFRPTMNIYESNNAEVKNPNTTSSGPPSSTVIEVPVAVKDYLLVSDYEVWHGEPNQPRTFNALYLNFEPRPDKQK